MRASPNGGGSITMDHNAWYYPSGGPQSWCPHTGTNALTSNPLVTSPTPTSPPDLEPTSSSPLIHAGVWNAALPSSSGTAFDFANVTRPNPPTIGAFEP